MGFKFMLQNPYCDSESLKNHQIVAPLIFFPIVLFHESLQTPYSSEYEKRCEQQ